MFDPFFFRHEIKKGQVAPMVEHPVEAGAVVVRLHSCPLKYCVNSVRVNTPVFQTGNYSSILYLRSNGEAGVAANMQPCGGCDMGSIPMLYPN